MEKLATATGYLVWAAVSSIVILISAFLVGAAVVGLYRRVRRIWWFHHRDLLHELHERSSEAISRGDESPALRWINQRIHKVAFDVGREQWGVALYLKPRAKRRKE